MALMKLLMNRRSGLIAAGCLREADNEEADNEEADNEGEEDEGEEDEEDDVEEVEMSSSALASENSMRNFCLLASSEAMLANSNSALKGFVI